MYSKAGMRHNVATALVALMIAMPLIPTQELTASNFLLPFGNQTVELNSLLHNKFHHSRSVLHPLR